MQVARTFATQIYECHEVSLIHSVCGQAQLQYHSTLRLCMHECHKVSRVRACVCGRACALFETDAGG
jgi:hypothetical protein